MSKYELKYRVIENSSYNDFNFEMKYTLIAVDYNPKTDLIRQRGYKEWGNHKCDLFSDKKAAEKWLCELNYNHFCNKSAQAETIKNQQQQITELEKALELSCKYADGFIIEGEGCFYGAFNIKDSKDYESAKSKEEKIKLHCEYFKTEAKRILKKYEDKNNE